MAKKFISAAVFHAFIQKLFKFLPCYRPVPSHCHVQRKPLLACIYRSIKEKTHFSWMSLTGKRKRLQQKTLIYCHQGQSQKTTFLLCLIKSITTITGSCFFQTLSITTIISITSINQSNHPITLNCSVLKNQSRPITLLIKQNTIKHY